MLGVRLLELPPAEDSGPGPRHLQRTVAAVDSVYRKLPLPDTCLRRAVVCSLLLGVERTSVAIGVGKSGAGIRAHAWLETPWGAVDVGPWSPPHPGVPTQRLKPVAHHDRGCHS